MLYDPFMDTNRRIFVPKRQSSYANTFDYSTYGLERKRDPLILNAIFFYLYIWKAAI